MREEVKLDIKVLSADGNWAGGRRNGHALVFHRVGARWTPSPWLRLAHLARARVTAIVARRLGDLGYCWVGKDIQIMSLDGGLAQRVHVS